MRKSGAGDGDRTRESKLPLLYFHNLQNRLGKINVHATHTVHALPDLRLAGGRWGDGFYHALQGLDCEDVEDVRVNGVTKLVTLAYRITRDFSERCERTRKTLERAVFNPRLFANT